MPDYRWGVFPADPIADRSIGFGDSFGQPVWQQVPGEFRSQFRRLIVTQGDTEPASVEQQHRLGHSCPSLYDLRNLFQINVEEGRHLWAMVYILHAYFGRDGREEAEELLARHSGDVDKPRILGTFNEPIEDWLSFFCFCYFTDRDGKFQLKSLAESSFDPLARTCRFMLTEEAHHMFVGETGLGRIVRRTLEVMKEIGSDDPEAIRRRGAVDLPLLHRSLNLWFSSSLDPFGSEVSSNAASTFANGIKGRPDETTQYQDHVCADSTFEIEVPDGKGGVTKDTSPMRNAMNEVLRDAYIRDCEIGLKRWNMQIKRGGYKFELKLPSSRFRRAIGAWANIPTDLEGRAIGGGAAGRRFRPNAMQTGTDLTDHRVGIRVHAQALQVLRDARGEPGTAGAGVVRHEMQQRGDQRFRTGRLEIGRIHRDPPRSRKDGWSLNRCLTCLSVALRLNRVAGYPPERQDWLADPKRHRERRAPRSTARVPRRMHPQEFAGAAGLCFPPNIDQAIHNPGNNTRA